MGKKQRAILEIQNGHIASCGLPPALTLYDGKWTCYFENVHGEQFIMQFDRNRNVCQLWSGDIGWEEELRVEEFRDKVIVRFARTSAERDAEFKMNKQFDRDLPAVPKADMLEMKATINMALRKVFGKPTLTDAECEYISNAPVLSPQEMGVIRAYWNICKQLKK